jgi:hypothetical protein
LLGGALLIPVAGASFGTPRYLAAAAAVLPMLALLVAIGVEQLVTLVVRPAPLEDDEGSMAAEGWNADDIAPRT